MLIDDVTIKIKAGDGGNGAVAFNKNLMSLGPAGASGGAGGSVYLEGVSDLSALNQFRFKKELRAENGADGRSQFRDGTDGKDLMLKVPVGTVIHVKNEKWSREITKIGERVYIANGGKGGRGNFHFRSSTNTSPKQFEPGTAGEKAELRLELKLIADVSFIGLPNVGKSSMLNELTSARSKVANYSFTTLEPNLGVYYELVLADIPGLIEGASSGKGLGIKFLRHIERTRILFHFISAESENPLADYRAVRKELGLYAKTLLKKPECVFLSKSDLVSPAVIKKQLGAFKKLKKKALPTSIHDWESVELIKKVLNEVKKEK